MYVSRRSITCKGFVEKRVEQRGPNGSYFNCKVARKKIIET